MISHYNDSYEISQADGVITFKNKNTTIRFTRFNDKREVEYIFVNPAFRKKAQANIYFLSQRKVSGEKKNRLIKNIRLISALSIVLIGGYFLTN